MHVRYKYAWWGKKSHARKRAKDERSTGSRADAIIPAEVSTAESIHSKECGVFQLYGVLVVGATQHRLIRMGEMERRVVRGWEVAIDPVPNDLDFCSSVDVFSPSHACHSPFIDGGLLA